MNRDGKLLVLREKFEHMGSHSGYDCLCEVLKKAGLNPDFVSLRSSWFSNLFTLLLRVLRKFGVINSPWYKGHNLLAELEIIRRSRKRPAIVHILCGENNLGLLSNSAIKGDRKLVVTIHQPTSWWHECVRDLRKKFNSVDALIVLSKAELEAFAELTSAKVHFVPHGIDTEFFTPADPELLELKISRATSSCVFVGQWLRDFHTLHEVMRIISERQLPTRFDIVVPKHPNMDSEILSLIERIEAFPFVSSHQNLTDVQLLTLYQHANFLVIPLQESTANNSILEGLSCGLPVITTETSGVRDYVDETCAMVFEQGDAAGIVEAIKALSINPELQKTMACEARKRAIALFSWERISQQITRIYRDFESPNLGRRQYEEVAHH